ncbi:MAG: NFACT family protein [Clostridia bacterium]|nr:NFACT family protein [Clostridia bacterium]
MALDGVAISALVKELNERLAGGKIDKIHQPERDEIIMHIRHIGENSRLLLCANPTFPRVHLTRMTKENPAQPPMFCMLLRKHLAGGKILGFEQNDFERIIKMNVEASDELGFMGVKSLIIEIMGKHSNIILTDGNGKILDSIYHVDITVSSVRQVLPGLMYELPPSQGKGNPLLAGENDIAAHLDGSELELKRQLMNAYSGISPMVASEIVYRATGSADTRGCDAVADVRLRAARCFVYIFDKIRAGEYTPTVLINAESGKMLDYSGIDITMYEEMAVKETYDSMSEALDSFYIKKATGESMRQKSGDLMKFVTNNIDRCRKKLQIQNETLFKVGKRDKYKLYGDLVTANIYRIQQGMTGIEVENYYSENGETVAIALESDLTPAQNAQKYYKRYNKDKTAEAETLKQKELNETEIDYLESVQQAIATADSMTELTQIRDELIEQGYLKNKGRLKKSMKTPAPQPLHFISSDGYDIYVGKNNRQNDYVTLKIGRSTDLWFHTKGIHGSHVVVKTGDAETVPDGTYIEAATLAAYYSKGRSGSNIPVDYTEVKNVKKPSGAKPGMVIYVNYSTLYTNPDEKVAEKLKNNKKI